ncbi:MAG: sensor histidine kinase, partial [Clostridiales Family XIII bacterium]|nr:sensor histidine kinase [Clostridiales Family XIII bacterium]
MKRFVITTIALLIVSAAAFCVISLPRDRGTERAEAGTLDLTGANFEDLIHPLDGEWDFYYGQLCAPEDFAVGAPAQPIGKSYVSVPGSWTDAGYPARGTGTYRLILETERESTLMLHMPEVTAACVVYIDGKKVHEAGRLGATDGYLPAARNEFISVTPKNGRTEIIVQAANRPGADVSGLYYSICVGRASVLLGDAMLRRVLLAAVFGMMLMMALYHFALFLWGRREKIYLWYILYVVVTVLRLSMESNALVQLFAPDGMTERLFGVFMSCFAAQALCLILFTFEVFGIPYWPRGSLAHTANTLCGGIMIADVQRRLRRILFNRIFYALCAGVMAVNIALYPIFPNFIPMPLVYTSMLPAIFVTVAVARRLKNAGEYRGLYFIALLLFFLWGVGAKVFGDNVFFVPGVLSNLFMTLTQAILLSRRYAEARAKEQSLAVENALLEQTAKTRADMVDILSHEVRTPLTVMSVYAQMAAEQIRDGRLDERTLADLVTVSDEAKRLSELTTDMLQLSRLTGCGADRAPVPVDVRALIDQIARLFEPLAKRAGRTISVHAQAHAPSVPGDAGALTRLFWNLLDNALTHGRGDIEIKVETVPNMLRVTVRDGGVIPPDLLLRVFGRGVFGAEGDTGLGLSICREIAARHGGE